MSAACTTPEAYRHCQDVVRHAARNFYYGLRLSPEPQRSALYAIYAWMRRADDLADDATDLDAARAALEAFRTATDAALAGAPDATDPTLVALSDVAAHHALDAAPFHAMLDGQRDDLDGATYETFDDLRVYCERVASTVGVICVTIWGATDPRATALAVDRGIAFQLTNILRDFVEDAQRGRTYLPADEFRAAGLTPDALLRWTDSGACGRFVIAQIERAAAYYERSAPLDAMITPSCRPTLRAMTAIYRGILGKMAARPFRVVLGRRVRLSVPKKVAIALRARFAPAARQDSAA